MPKEIRREEVRKMVAEGAQLVEVLPSPEYEEEHLPGAIHVPIRTIDSTVRDVLDPSRAVIVYCWDTTCDMSPRAAWWLESLCPPAA